LPIYKSGRAVYRAAVLGLSLAVFFAVACETEKDRKAAANARIEKEAAKEINRICALPDDQREAELKKIKEQSGMVLYCGTPHP
jgi:hypothetical protein